MLVNKIVRRILVCKYAKKLLPKNLKLLPFNVKEKEMRKKIYIQVALELTLVKEFGPFLGVHSKNMDYGLFSLVALHVL